MRKFTVKTADNGYILTVTDQGVSVLKTLYTSPLLVFPTLTQLLLYIYIEKNIKRGRD